MSQLGTFGLGRDIGGASVVGILVGMQAGGTGITPVSDRMVGMEREGIQEATIAHIMGHIEAMEDTEHTAGIMVEGFVAVDFTEVAGR